MDIKWLAIIGGVLILGYLFIKSGGLPSSQPGTSFISIPDTQTQAATNSLADAIAQLNTVYHPSNPRATTK